MNKTEKAVLGTLAFFHLWRRPLTLEEIWRFLYRLKASRFQVLCNVQKLCRNKVIIQQGDFFALSGDRQIFREFAKKQEVVRKYWQKVKWVGYFLRLVPFVRGLFVINSLSYSTADEKSDIDILIIARKNRLWTARAATVLLLEILGQNKNQWYQAGKFCLGFAFDEKRLNLGFLRLDRDILFSYWIAHLTPVWGRKIYQNLLNQNTWIFDELPNWQFIQAAILPEPRKTFLERILSGQWGDGLERKLATIQIRRIQNDKKNQRPGGSVVADSGMMKLHPYDKRLWYRGKWQKKVRHLAGALDKK